MRLNAIPRRVQGNVQEEKEEVYRSLSRNTHDLFFCSCHMFSRVETGRETTNIITEAEGPEQQI